MNLDARCFLVTQTYCKLKNTVKAEIYGTFL